MFPKLSIVTPSYNQGAFLEETIRSVISQEGDFSLDYIIVDGGSTDNSLEIIRKYEALFKEGKWPIQCRGIRYHWMSERDRGQSAAINKGFRLVEGDIAAWLNSDDYYVPGAFAKIVMAFHNDKSLAMIYGDGETVDKAGNRRNKYDVETVFDLWKLIHLYDFILQPSVFMRLEALKSARYLDERLHYIMDWELWIRLSRFGKIRHLPEKLSCARFYPEAKTQASGINRWKEIRWCSKKYGHMKWPPVVFTQLFHRPVNVIFGGTRDMEGMIFSSLTNSLRKVYYSLIGGNRSGIYADGYVERFAFLSIPLRPEISKLTIRIKPLCSNHVRYYINNRYSGTISLYSDIALIEVAIAGEIERSSFLHIKFISDKDMDIEPLPPTFTPRKGSFLIDDISLQKEDGSGVRDIGLPGYRETPC